MTTVTAAEVTLDIDAPPAEVFRYLTDPARYVRWMGRYRSSGDMPAGSTRVTVTLAAEGDRTRLTLRHDNLPSADLAAAHQVAWDTYLPRLAAAAVGADPGPDPHGAA